MDDSIRTSMNELDRKNKFYLMRIFGLALIILIFFTAGLLWLFEFLNDTQKLEAGVCILVGIFFFVWNEIKKAKLIGGIEE